MYTSSLLSGLMISSRLTDDWHVCQTALVTGEWIFMERSPKNWKAAEYVDIVVFTFFCLLEFSLESRVYRVGQKTDHF